MEATKKAARIFGPDSNMYAYRKQTEGLIWRKSAGVKWGKPASRVLIQGMLGDTNVDYHLRDYPTSRRLLTGLMVYHLTDTLWGWRC